MEKLAYSVEEVAKLLGYSDDHIRRAIKDGKLKAMGSGRGYRISRPDIEAYYQSQGGGKLFDSNGENRS